MAKLYFYYSAMNAGKSTILLQSSHNYRERGMNTLLFTPKIDNRFEVGKIHSRIGLSELAEVFSSEDNLFEITKKHYKKLTSLSCVLLDEAQFLTKEQVYELSEICDKLKIPVLTYGIRTDFRGELFTGSKYLLAWADELNEVKTICHCGKKATMVLRTTENGEVISDGEQIAIGGNTLYTSTCRKHFKLKQPRPLTQEVTS